MPVSRGWRVVGRGAAPGPPCTVGPVAAVEGVAGTTVAAKAVAATASVPDWLPVAPNSCVPPPSRFLNQMAVQGENRNEKDQKKEEKEENRERARFFDSIGKEWKGVDRRWGKGKGRERVTRRPLGGIASNSRALRFVRN